MRLSFDPPIRVEVKRYWRLHWEYVSDGGAIVEVVCPVRDNQVHCIEDIDRAELECRRRGVKLNFGWMEEVYDPFAR